MRELPVARSRVSTLILLPSLRRNVSPSEIINFFIAISRDSSTRAELAKSGMFWI
jgi:hypothetical protein